jgi:fused signal recognition particle receptor
MEELAKIVRVIGRDLPGAPHETLLVLDANTGQNAISQARVFTEPAGVTGHSCSPSSTAPPRAA